MAEVEIRPAVSTDITILEGFDHTCETTHVWQFNHQVSRDRVVYDLREVRLPRVLRLEYPRRASSLKDTWTQHSLFLVARSEGELVGYLILDQEPDLDSAVIRDIVVDLPYRRQGIATALILAAKEWLIKIGVTRLVFEVPAKNHPMIELMRKLHINFMGLTDNYYANHDCAFFYTHLLK
jgi:ribosomal protein S18 acetylase RimI-like enzyme